MVDAQWCRVHWNKISKQKRVCFGFSNRAISNSTALHKGVLWHTIWSHVNGPIFLPRFRLYMLSFMFRFMFANMFWEKSKQQESLACCSNAQNFFKFMCSNWQDVLDEPSICISWCSIPNQHRKAPTNRNIMPLQTSCFQFSLVYRLQWLHKLMLQW